MGFIKQIRMGISIKLIRHLTLLFALLLFVSMVNANTRRPLIVPKPKSTRYGSAEIVVKDCISFKTNNANNNFINSLRSMYEGMFFRDHPTLIFGHYCGIAIDLQIEDPNIMMPKGFEPKDERYTLQITESGDIRIQSKYKVGVLRAMDTLSQLFEYDEDQIKLPFLPLHIEDEPRYGYRGLLLDLSRTFYPTTTLRQIIDGLRMTKINVLHLHLTDDDSIPIEFPSFPGMTNYTAFTPSEFYTVNQLKELVRYAEENGVKVIPEVDIPGHTRAFGDDPRLTHLLTWMNHVAEWPMPDQSIIHGGPSSAVLNPTMNETYAFVKTILKDLNTLFPHAEFVHLGGDEVNTNDCWVSDEKIQQFMKDHKITDGNDLFKIFQTRVGEIAKEANKRTAHWVYDDNFDLRWDEGSILQYWGKLESLKTFKATYPDHKHILSLHDYFYFDCGLGNRYGGSLCNPYQTWAKIRTFEPTQYYDEKDDTLLGGEACMWSELNSYENVFNKVWPKLGVVSNVFWSPKHSEAINWGDVVEELVRFRDNLRANGIPANQVSSRYWEAHPHEVFKNFTAESFEKLIQ